MITLELPTTKAEIKSVTTKLLREIDEHKEAIEMLECHLYMIQDRCSHEGQETGCNDRDGSWANRCPICSECH